MMGIQNDGEDKPMDDESYSWANGEYKKSLGVSTNPRSTIKASSAVLPFHPP